LSLSDIAQNRLSLMANASTHLEAVSPMRMKCSERTQRVARRDDSTRLLASQRPAQRHGAEALAKAS
jgi:2-oxoglutarate dehydrogenase complex dehydrogenase (E1) component-like enzyme